jgi:death-on-curing protein
LAAAYGFGLSKNHAFVDGNKRIALISIQLFLEINGWHLTATDDQCVYAMVGVAAGEISESDLAKWVREHVLQFEGNRGTEFVRPKLN